MELQTKMMESDFYIAKHEPTFARAEELYALVVANRDHLLPWLDWAHESITDAPESSYNFMKGTIDKWNAGTAFDYGIFDSKTNKIIGGVGVPRYTPQHKMAEIGYWLAKDFSGRGIMTRAVKLLETDLFNNGIFRIEIRNEVMNTPSANVARRCGYKLDGVLRRSHYSPIRKESFDANVFSKIRGE